MSSVSWRRWVQGRAAGSARGAPLTCPAVVTCRALRPGPPSGGGQCPNLDSESRRLGARPRGRETSTAEGAVTAGRQVRAAEPARGEPGPAGPPLRLRRARGDFPLLPPISWSFDQFGGLLTSFVPSPALHPTRSPALLPSHLVRQPLSFLTSLATRGPVWQLFDQFGKESSASSTKGPLTAWQRAF